MDITILVSKILAIYITVSGLFILIKGNTVPHLLKDFFDHPAIVYLTGIILIFLSSIYLLQHNVWDGTWRTLITVFVWIVMLKGLSYIFIPEALSEISVQKMRGLFGVYGLIAIVVGVYLFFLK